VGCTSGAGWAAASLPCPAAEPVLANDYVVGRARVVRCTKASPSYACPTRTDAVVRFMIGHQAITDPKERTRWRRFSHRVMGAVEPRRRSTRNAVDRARRKWPSTEFGRGAPMVNSVGVENLPFTGVNAWKLPSLKSRPSA